MAEFMVDILQYSCRPERVLNPTRLQTKCVTCDQDASEQTCNTRSSNQRSCRKVNTGSLKYKVGGCVELRKMDESQYSSNKSLHNGRFGRSKLASSMSIAGVIGPSCCVLFLLLDVIKGFSLNNNVSHPVLSAVTPAFVTSLPRSEDVTSGSAASTTSLPSIRDELARAFPPLSIYSTLRVPDDIISPLPSALKFDDVLFLSPDASPSLSSQHQQSSLTTQVGEENFEALTRGKDQDDGSSQSQNTTGTISGIEATSPNPHPSGQTIAEVRPSPESSIGHDHISTSPNIFDISSNMASSTPTLKSRLEPEYISTNPTAFDLTPDLVLTSAPEYTTVDVATSDRTPRSSASPVMSWLWPLDFKGAILVYGLGVLCVLLLVSILVVVPSYFLMRLKARRLDIEARTNCLENLEKDFVVDLSSEAA